MPPNMRIHPTGFASLRSARLRVMREPLGAASSVFVIMSERYVPKV